MNSPMASTALSTNTCLVGGKGAGSLLQIGTLRGEIKLGIFLGFFRDGPWSAYYSDCIQRSNGLASHT